MKMNKIENILFILCLIIVIIPFSAVYPYLSFHVSMIFLVFIITSVLLYTKQILIPVWILNILSLFLIIFTFLKISPDDILLPSIEALTIIISIRLIGKKTSREYFQIYLLSILFLGSSSLLNLSMTFIARLVLMLVLVILSILLIAYFKETNENIISRKRLLSLAKISLFTSIISIPLSILFFFTLPRTPHPLFDIGMNKSKTGFTSVVNLGGVAVIEEDSTTTMRVMIKKLPNENLYWRVITFDSFDGKKWTKTFLNANENIFSGEQINYTINLEPLTDQYLPVLDYPLNIQLKNVIYEYPGTFRVNFVIEKPIKYVARSYINAIIKEPYPSPLYLKLPSNLSDRLTKLTNSITSDSNSEMEMINKILKYLSSYEYSLKNLPSGNNPVDDFLFNKKRGNCEYFATSMALMLRIKGIPSRVVGGFRGGTYNNFGNYYIVRAADAHLWVEAWINGEWKRFDPSGRILRVSEPVIFHFIDYVWHKIVLDYDFMAQMRLAKSIKPPEIKIDKRLLILLPVVILIIFLTIKTCANFIDKRDPIKKFFVIMKKLGFERKKTQGLEEFVDSISEPNLKEKAKKFIRAYEEFYFRDKEFNKAKIKELNDLLKEINENYKSRKS